MLDTIRKSFPTKLSLTIILLAVPIFILSLGTLYFQSRHIIRKEAVGHAYSVLDAAMNRITRNLMVIENATNANSWIVEQSFTPETLIDYSGRIVRLNPMIDGCSISAEPDMFPKYGRYFSVYTVKQPDTVMTVIEEKYEYFEKAWYKTAHDQKETSWIVYKDESDTLTLSLEGLLASYSKPLFDSNNRVLGIISTDLSLKRLSEHLSEEKPYPNSYFIMTGADGRFFIHPDKSQQFTKTIFSDADPRENADIIALGHEMTKGKTGRMVVNIDGSTCLVLYRPIPETGWSLALVCPDSDILAGYNKLKYIIIPLIVIGLLLILLLTYQAVNSTIRPLNILLDKTQTIATGNMEVYIPKSQREDVVGRVQNSFASMLWSLNFHMGSVRYSTERTRLRNEELTKATRLVQEADRQKSTFIQNVSHQIRTPLNIIMGFAQVLNDTNSVGLSDEETKSITDMMDHNSKLLNRMLLMLFDSSDVGLSEELKSTKSDMVICNTIAIESVENTNMHYPNLHIEFQSELANDFCIRSNSLYLMRTLRELLYNAAKYSDGKNIKLQVTHTDSTVHFIVQDTGKGISETESKNIFKFFTKVDDLSEGLGLGLPLAKRHAQNLGGDLILDTDYHEGCRFIVDIPY